MTKLHHNLYIKSLSIYFMALILGAINIGPIGSLLKILGFVPILICLLENRGRYVVNKLVIGACVFLSWTMFSALWSIEGTDSFIRGLTQLSFFLMLLSASSYKYDIDEINYLRKALIWSSRLSAIVTFLFAVSLQGRLWLNGIINEDPNYLCNYFAFGVVNCIIVLCSKNDRLKHKCISFIELMLYLYIVMATGSRGGALAISVMILVEYFCINKNRKLSLNSLALKMLLLFFFTIGLNFITDFMAEDILNRFSMSSIASSGGTGRYQIWEDTLNAYADADVFRQFFGFGTGTAKTIASMFHFTYVNVIHNIYLENLIEVGLIGFVFYVIYIFRYWNFTRKADYYSFAIITGLMVMSMSTSMAAFKPYWNILLYATCISRLQSSKERVVKCND